MNHNHQQRKDTHGQHDDYRDRFDHHRRSHHRTGEIPARDGEGRAVSTALTSLAQLHDASSTITRTLFVGLAMIESIAIYCLVISMILIFANPFWHHVIAKATGK